jgi:hypothetical protein
MRLETVVEVFFATLVLALVAWHWLRSRRSAGETLLRDTVIRYDGTLERGALRMRVELADGRIFSYRVDRVLAHKMSDDLLIAVGRIDTGRDVPEGEAES